MDQSLPGWLNNDFFIACLQKEEGREDIVVTNYTASQVVPPGNNYGSFIIIIRVEYKPKTGDSELRSKSLILKSEPTQGAVKELFDNLNDLQLTEYDFYYKFLPKAEKLTDTRFAPRSFFSPKSCVTILEDLKEKGFVMANRIKQLDFNHCRLYMEAAASMHAISFAIHKEDPTLIQSIGKEKIFTDDASGCELFKAMIKAGMKILADICEEIDRFNKYSKVIRGVAPSLWEKLVEIHKPSIIINTINQGDPWTTNMMFKYDGTGNVCEVKLVDFQCLSYNCPINDVVFFIWSSANNDVKSHKLDELYQIYLETFNSNLEQLQCAEKLTREHFSDCVNRLSPKALFSVACMLPLLSHQDPVDFGQFLPKESENNEETVLNHLKHYYNDKYCKEQVPLSLEHLEKAGVFDYLEKLVV